MLCMVLKYLPVLGVAIAVNIILGMYNNIGVYRNNFDWTKFLNGILKSISVAIAFIGLAYCFDATGATIDLGVFDVNPEMILTSAIILYVGKGLTNLLEILGVGSSKKN